MKKTKNKIFAKGICFDKIMFVFIIGCLFGAYYEEIYCFLLKIINSEPLIWETRRGMIYGPFSPIYGFGAIIIALALCQKERPIYKTFLYAGLLGGTVEYLASYFQELVIGTVSWDYRGEFLNIGGRTGIIYMIAWGLIGVFFVHLVYPFISKLIEKIPYQYGKPLITVLSIFVIFDFTISMTALFRQTFRQNGHKPFTIIGEMCDKLYPDERLNKVYNNMKKTE